MVRFIKQEAEEKANEIKVSAEEVRGTSALRLGARTCRADRSIFAHVFGVRPRPST